MGGIYRMQGLKKKLINKSDEKISEKSVRRCRVRWDRLDSCGSKQTGGGPTCEHPERAAYYLTSLEAVLSQGQFSLEAILSQGQFCFMQFVNAILIIRLGLIAFKIIVMAKMSIMISVL
jgi:hypothetical protein